MRDPQFLEPYAPEDAKKDAKPKAPSLRTCACLMCLPRLPESPGLAKVEARTMHGASSLGSFCRRALHVELLSTLLTASSLEPRRVLANQEAGPGPGHHKVLCIMRVVS